MVVWSLLGGLKSCLYILLLSPLPPDIVQWPLTLTLTYMVTLEPHTVNLQPGPFSLLPPHPMLHSPTPCSSRIFQPADVLKTQPHHVHYSCQWLLLALTSQPLPDTHCQHATVSGKLSATGWVFQTGHPVERVQQIPIG